MRKVFGCFGETILESYQKVLADFRLFGRAQKKAFGPVLETIQSHNNRTSNKATRLLRNKQASLFASKAKSLMCR